MARKQIGAFAYQIKQRRVQLLLVTNRRASRWILPKGQPEPHLSDADVALMEANEEGGVIGDLNDRVPPYTVELPGRRGSIDLHVYCVSIRELLQEWPESRLRQRELLDIDAAMRRVDRRPLRECIRALSEKVAAIKTESV